MAAVLGNELPPEVKSASLRVLDFGEYQVGPNSSAGTPGMV